ncbi:hypothetical protein Pfo_019254 [Paulownia fortunei]|nr:hypothetical protein Pfo_019254 [Paulownia fortunei]
MPPPQHIKHIQQLIGILAYLNHFISRSADKGFHFFRVLYEGKNFEWTEECQHAFDDLKKYLVFPLLLTKPEVGETLFLYLVVATEAISVVLVREVGQAHQLIYYTIKILQGTEQRYLNIEKLALALITATRKLRPYFQSHLVVVLTNHPLKQVLSNSKTSGRMVKWAIELNEHEIEFCPRPTIKAQVLANFVVEMTNDETINSLSAWTLYVDGSSTLTGSGARIVIESPQGDKFEFALKFEFLTSNNEAEYEALLAGLKLAFAAGARKLTIYSDSQLMVNQVRGKADNMITDQLTKLASSMASINTQKITFLSSSHNKIDGIGLQILCVDKKEPRELLKNPVDAQKLKTRTAHFLIIDRELYKRGFSQPYLKCLTPTKANYVLRKIHEGICGNHLGGKSLATKVLRQGYFWPTL